MSSNLKDLPVLIVDDIEHNRYLLRMMLTNAGCKINEATNGKEAIAILEAGPIGLIISDILMPEMDGYEFCRACKRHEQWKNIPFVFYTATYTTKEDEAFALSLGAARFIIKPQEHTLFMRAMHEVMRDWQADHLQTGEATLEDESEYLKLYNERLIKKLEDKLSQLEQSNAALNEELIARREAETKANVLLAAIEQAGEAVIITDTRPRIIYVNQAFTDITGYSSEDVIGKNPSLLASGEQDHQFYSHFWEMLAEEKVWSGPIVDRRKDGSTYTALMAVSAVKDAQGKLSHYISIQKDMTEYKQLEAQFHEAQKMEAIGTLAGGIAHDFNNMLAAITMSTYLLRQQDKDPVQVNARIDTIQHACERAQKMIQQMLTFARKDQPTIEPTDLVQVVRQALHLARASVPESIRIDNDLPDQPIFVEGSDAQIEQMLLNLLHNARDALEGREHPCISVSMRCEATAKDGSAHACIEVSDNGPGIAKKQLQHIFDPFFTTKEVGKGTGLGLAMVYGGMKNHGGDVRVDSSDQGASFRLYFPIVEQPAEQISESKVAMVEGKERKVLLADDNDYLRDTLNEVLTGLGFEVVSASDGEAAVEAFISEPESFAMAVLDVVMPGISGVAAATKMREKSPSIPFLFITGYDTNSVLPAGQNTLQPFAVLKKPFPMDACSQAIQRLLGDTPENMKKRG